MLVIASVSRTEKRNCFRSHDQEDQDHSENKVSAYNPPDYRFRTLGLDPSIIDRRCVIIVNFWEMCGNNLRS